MMHHRILHTVDQNSMVRMLAVVSCSNGLSAELTIEIYVSRRNII